MKDSDHEIIILTPPGDAYSLFSHISGIKVYECGELPITALASGLDYPILRSIYGHLRYLKNYRKVDRLINKLQPDIVHLNDVGMGYGARIAKRYNAKVIMHVRLVLSAKRKIFLRLTNFFIRRYVDAVISIDQSAHNKITHKVKRYVVYNPVSRLPNTVKIVEKKQSADLVVLFLANLLPYKGIYEFLEVADRLKTEKNIRFIIAGGNSRPKEVYSSFIGKILSALRIFRDHVELVQGIIQSKNMTNVEYRGYIQNINDLLNEVDILLLPSFMNQTSRCIYEAALYGVPSIITMRDKVEDVIIDGITGYICNEKDINNMERHIKSLNNNRKIIDILGNNARKKIFKQHDILEINKSINAIYKDLLIA